MLEDVRNLGQLLNGFLVVFDQKYRQNGVEIQILRQQILPIQKSCEVFGEHSNLFDDSVEVGGTATVHAESWEFRQTADWNELVAGFVAHAVFAAELAMATQDPKQVSVGGSVGRNVSVKQVELFFGYLAELLFEPLGQAAIGHQVLGVLGLAQSSESILAGVFAKHLG